MTDTRIAAVAVAAFVVVDGVVVDRNDAAAAVLPETDWIGRRWDDCVGATVGHDVRFAGDHDARWFRIHRADTGADSVVTATDVTDELRARAILEQLFADCFVLDRDARLQWKLNPVDRAASSWSVDSHPIDQLHPDDLPASLERFAASLAEPGRRDVFSLRVKHPAQAGVWERINIDAVSGVADPRLDGVAICSRVQEALDTEVGLVDSPFYSLAAAAPTGIVVLDGSGRPTYLNDLARQLLRVGPTQGPETWTDALGPRDRAAVRTLVGSSVADDARRHHLAEINDDLGATWLRIEAVAQRSTAGVVGTIVSLVDLTDQIEARADIDRLVDALQAGSDLVLVVTPDLRVSHATGSDHERFTGFESAIIGDVRDILADDPGLAATFADGVAQVLGGQSWRGELAIRVDDTDVPVSVLCVPRKDADGIVESFAFVARDISDLKQTQHRLAHLAMHDPLTGLWNRLGLRDELDAELVRWRRGERYGLAVAFIDLDDFKSVNDEFGHEAGDHVLRDVATRLQHSVRTDDIVARLGGDEFVAVLSLPSLQADVVARVADRLADAFTTPVLLGGRAVRLGASVGIVVARPPDEDAVSLLARADAAMYRAKRAGKNRVLVA